VLLDTESRLLSFYARLAIDRASQVLSKILRKGASIELLDMSVADISLITERMGEGNIEVSAALTNFYEDFSCKFLLFVEMKDTFILTDLFLHKPIGTTKEFDIYVESTVQETCNILASCFCNVLGSHFGVKARPTPPVVINDYLGIVFSTFIMDRAFSEDQLLMLETRFRVLDYDIKCCVFALPAPEAVNTLISVFHQ
jgi:chemotaxis protein CheC